MEFNFTPKEGTGITKLIPNVTQDVQEIITKLLLYDHSSRMSASQALKHPYFRELREADKFLQENSIGPTAMRLTKRAGDSFSQQSKR